VNNNNSVVARKKFIPRGDQYQLAEAKGNKSRKTNPSHFEGMAHT